MPAPSQLAIATSSVLRLLKEEVSYRKELVDQEAKVKVLEEKVKSGQASEDGNDEFMLKQQVRTFPLLIFSCRPSPAWS
jgi:tubulin-specific chaperone A